jgi:(hydroxyamino)benzene mutase
MAVPVFQKSLVVAGASLFLVGLLQGAALHSFANPRMALSAHLTAVQSGMALMIAGIVWSAVMLSPRLATISRLTVITGIYLLWLGLTLSAATGANEALPIAGAGFGSSRLGEMVVSATVLIGSGLMTVGWILLLIGLVRARQP